MIQVTFRLRRDQPLGRVTARYPDTRLLVWCNLATDVAEVRAPSAAEADEVVAALRKESRDAWVLPGASASRTVILPCATAKERSVTRLVETVGLMVPPLLAEKGWDQFRVVLLDPTALPGLLRSVARLGEVELIQKVPLTKPFASDNLIVPAAELTAGLSSLQTEAYMLAVAAGYYAVPRRVSVADLAQRLHRPRATLQEHLRKAEAKLLNALAPFVGMRAPAPVARRGKDRRGPLK